MNWYTALVPGRLVLPASLNGEGVFVCDNPLGCWEYFPSNLHTEIWRVLPTGEVTSGAGYTASAKDAILLEQLPLWELYAYSNSRFAYVTTAQRLLSGGSQTIYAYGESCVGAQDQCFVQARDNALVNASDEVVVEAWNDARVVLAGRSRCYAHDRVQVTLIGQDASVTFPKKSKVNVTLIDGNPNRILSDGRYFRSDIHDDWLKQVQKETELYNKEDFWDKVPWNTEAEEKRQSAKEGLSLMFG